MGFGMVYRFLNNPERTMSGAALFGIALITGNKIVFTMALLGHFAHWWFLSWVEGYESLSWFLASLGLHVD